MARKHKRGEPDRSETEVLASELQETLPEHADLYEEMRATIKKFENDHATRGDLKIINRALKELRYAFRVFTPYRRRRKVTVFGSARTEEDHPAYQHAVAFGKRMAEEDWMVLTGAGGGIMEAAHVGSGREMAMGVNIMLPFEQEANPIIDGDPKLVHLKYFFTRKLLFVKEVHAIALFPGGFGTMDEAFETLTLVQTGKRDLMPIVMVDEPGGTYWKNWEEFVRKELFDANLISPEDLSLYKVTEDLEEAVEELVGFYSAYHSMRFVRDDLILRLSVAPDDQFIERLNDEFSDIVASGRIERCGVHYMEADETHLADLPRLSLHFNRRDLGRLRQMVDLINEELG